MNANAIVTLPLCLRLPTCWLFYAKMLHGATSECHIGVVAVCRVAVGGRNGSNRSTS